MNWRWRPQILTQCKRQTDRRKNSNRKNSQKFELFVARKSDK
jgi:hypothetical protein